MMRLNGVCGLGVAASLLAVGCAEWKTGGNIGGANQGVRSPGNRQGGIMLEDGDVAVSANGKFFATLREGRLVLGDVGGTTARALDSLPRVERIAFWPHGDGEGVFVLAGAQRDGTDGQPERVISYNRAEDRVVWEKQLTRRDRWIDVTPDGRRLILSGTDLQLLDAATGQEIGTPVQGEMPVRDLDITRDGRFFIVTQETSWAGDRPKTRIESRRTEDGTKVCEVEADNCADEMEVTEDNRAFLAPTLCQKDPVTVMKVGEECGVERQMPGFGPVAMSPDGKTAMAFIDRDVPVDPEGPAIPAEVKSSNTRFHLMVIDVKTLEFRTQPVAQDLPRYTYTPDGHTLVVDQPMDVLSAIETFDLLSGAHRAVQGPRVKLHRFAFSPDSRRAFFLSDGVFELDLANNAIRAIPLPFMPSSVNVSQDGLTVLLTNTVDRTVRFMDADTKEERGRASY
ncbi:MAG: hypothetical protein AB2A00_18960 [Myxococcota bacterium]